jgi:hypothetical protein
LAGSAAAFFPWPGSSLAAIALELVCRRSLTAARHSLPFGARVRVSNPENTARRSAPKLLRGLRLREPT